MTYVTALTAAVSVVGAVCVIGYLLRVERVWRRLRGERVVTCPETGFPAAVRIDVAHAAATEIGRGESELRLAACSRWQTRGPCDEPCLLEAQEPASRVSAIAASWSAGKACIYCREPLSDDPLVGHRAAFLDADGITREWSDVPAEKLSDALRNGWPVCWNCHIAATFRREHPQLVTDRTLART